MEVVEILRVISYFFCGYILFYSGLLFIFLLTESTKLFHNRYKEVMHNKIEHDYYVPVSILMPTYNNAKVIVSRVKMLFSLDYKLYEVIVINNGSSDDTLEKLKKEFTLKKVERPYNKRLKTEKIKGIYEGKYKNILITVVDKENGSRADSFNAGINVARYPYFLTLTVDSFLQRDSVEKMVRPILEEENVVLCCGALWLGDTTTLKNKDIKKYVLPKKVLACMQILEHDCLYLSSKIMSDDVKASLSVSGAFGLFKKDIVLDCGGYDLDTSGDTFYMANKISRFCKEKKKVYHIRYVPEAVCFKQTSTSLKGIINERIKWNKAFFKSMQKYRKVVLNFNNVFLKFFSYLYYLFYKVLAPVIGVLGIVSIIVTICLGILDIKFIVFFYLFYILFNCLISLAVLLSKLHSSGGKLSLGDGCKVLLVCFFETIFLRFIFLIVCLFSYKLRKN